jgi:hypothetical protein
MIPSDETRRSRPRHFISVISLLGFGLSLCSVGLIVGCDDGKSGTIQIEKAEDPAQKAKDSMDYYRNNKMKKPGAPKK